MQTLDPTLPTQSINFKYPFQFGPGGGFATNSTTVDAVADDLKVLIKTNWGERPIHYDFGANLRALIFNQTGEVEQQITDAITAAVQKWMPYVNIDSLNVVETENDSTVDYNQVRIDLQFSVGKTGLTGELTLVVS